jgi:hypothetical protein
MDIQEADAAAPGAINGPDGWSEECVNVDNRSRWMVGLFHQDARSHPSLIWYLWYRSLMIYYVSKLFIICQYVGLYYFTLKAGYLLFIIHQSIPIAFHLLLLSFYYP